MNIIHDIDLKKLLDPGVSCDHFPLHMYNVITIYGPSKGEKYHPDMII